DVALGILPLGTFNRLARDLDIPLDPAEAAQAMATGAIRRIDVARVSDQLCLNNSILGLPPDVNESRNRLRGLPATDRLAGYWRAASSLLRGRHRLAIGIDDGKGRRALRVMTIAVSNNPFADRPRLLLGRDRLDSGMLGLYISRHENVLGFAWAMMR